jgi:hypothetical protein
MQAYDGSVRIAVQLKKVAELPRQPQPTSTRLTRIQR